ELGGVSGTGTVGLNIDGNYLSLSFPQQVQLADVSIANGSQIGVFASDGISTGMNVGNQDILGGINITARSVAVTNGAGLLTTTLGQGNAGSITINARDSVTLDGVKVASTVSEGAFGLGGNINITTGSLALNNGTLLATSTSGRGNAGSITINARDTISLDGVSSNGSSPSGIFGSVSQGAVGLGGNINITTGSLALTNGAQLLTATSGGGNAGDITINARDTISLDSNSSLFSNVLSNVFGNGGNINITTGSLTVGNGATVETNTSGGGNAGSITINARDTIFLDGMGMNSDGTPLPSSISSGDLRPNDFTIGQGTASSVSSDVSSNVFGNEGNINIATGSLKVTNGAQLNTNNYGQGSGGDITINARDTVVFDGLVGKFASGALSRVIAGTEGKSGNINITTGSLALTHGAQLDTTTLGNASAGNVTINARDTVTFDDSSALSSVAEGAVGTGGTIDITTGALTVTNGAQLSAGTFGEGDAGNVRINARDRITVDG
ncbi:MAG: S-layer family protein, partial [Candidatus Eremiobacteraeota bacterium]|nr:S-layer family protein [Candidatus Eremiobacteraeota bacterium]